MNIAVNCTRCQDIRMMSGEVDIRDCSTVTVQIVLDRSLRIEHAEIPY